MRLFRVHLAAVALLCLGWIQAQAATLHGPSPYLSVMDRPYDMFLPGQTVQLQDFESDSGPWEVGFTMSEGMRIGPKFISGDRIPVTDSVDEDDGELDGNGVMGSSWYGERKSLTITFDDPVSAAGFVWTDGDVSLTNVKVEWKDVAGMVIGSVDAGDIADDVYTGTTQEDRFFGAVADAGEAIKSVTVSIDKGVGLEVDHVQFAVAVPEPTSTALALIGLVPALGLLRRRR